MEYVGENVTAITFETDVFQTWYFQINYKKCFVEREHVNDDSVGANTVPEGLETGEYICNSKDSSIFNDYAFVLELSQGLGQGGGNLSTNVNGIWCAGHFYVFNNIQSLTTVIRAAQQQSSPQIDILSVYIVPSFLLGTEDYNTTWDGFETPVFYTKTVTKQTTLDSYVPVNNKLKCYPYNYLLETNSSGASNVLKYELFASDPSFSIGGTATVGASIVSIPINYKEGDETNMLTCSKFPTCSWSSDAYQAWLSQQGINIGGLSINAEQYGYGTGILSLGAGVIAGITGNVALSATLMSHGLSNITDTLASSMQYEKQPVSYKGNLNNGDIITASKKNGFYFYKMSIKKEYAESIDQFFTKFGYKVNALKVPNFTGRAYFNYIQISSDDIIGNSNASITVPETSMDIINNVFRRGTTIWHNHDNIGNYNLSNTINS